MISRNANNRIFLLFSLLGVLLSFSSCGKYLEGTGFVYAQDTRKPLKDVLVQAYLDHPATDAFQMQTYTEEDGGYYVRTDKVGCGFFCPDLVVQLVKDGYQTEIIKNPNGDTVFLKKR